MKFTLLAALVSLAVSAAALGPLGGVNMGGFDFTVWTNGSFTGPDVPPPTSQFAHFAGEGANLFRIPFAWQLATPTVGGTVSSSWLSQYDNVVNAALATGAYVIVDLHNYARWNGGIINQGGPTIAQYTSLWTQLAQHYASQSKIIFGLMNEPHDLPNNSLWPPAVQAAVNAIRAAGAKTQNILLPGSSWSGARQLPTELGPALLGITDPQGGTSKLIFDVHMYLDSDDSGTHTNCVTNNVDVFTTLSSWLATNKRQAILSETGGGRDDSTCFTNLEQELAFIKCTPSTIAGFAVWAAGSFDTTYALSVTPFANGTDAPLWINAIKPNLPGSSTASCSTKTTTSSSSSSSITHTSSSSSKSSSSSSSSGGGGGSVPKYGQCGGIGWTGGTVCAAGSTCQVSNPYYSQCL